MTKISDTVISNPSSAATAGAVLESDAKLASGFAAARKVTEQEQASQYARSLIEASLDPLVTISVQGKITDVNEASVQATGVPREQLIGTDFSDYFTEPNKARSGYQKVFSEGLVRDYPLAIRHVSGRLMDVLYNATVYKNDKGEILGVFAAARDVTEQKQASQYARSLIEASLDPLVTISVRGKITDVNEASVQATGVPREQLIGTDFSDYFTEPDKARSGYQKVFSEGLVRDYPLAIRHVSGRVMDVLYNATVYRNDKGEILGVFAAARDVTEQKLLQQVLLDRNIDLERAISVAEKANLAKSDFLSSMSHELRTPLNAILGFAQLLESDTPPPTPIQMRSLEQILQSGWHLLTLINEVLDLAKVESGHVSLSQEPVSLAEVILECQEMIAPQAQKRDIRMSFPLLKKPHFVRADRTRVKQVLLNLLSNAIKYNTKQGAVEVKVTVSTRGRMRVSVRDTGAGLYPEQLAQLFQPFNRLGQEAEGVEGTGIGLVVSKRLIELMGGSIDVESTVGVGSLFWFDLIPIAEPSISVEEIDGVVLAQPHVPRESRQHSLLYVEDNPANMELVKQIIARHPDISLLTAVDGYSGIEMARASFPDVIIMDINMPGMNGYEALEILQSNPSTAHIPILALTANAMPQDIRKGLEAGFLRYITKPIMVHEFMEALNVALESAEMRGSQRK